MAAASEEVMRTIIIATLLAGCVTQPLESTTEQQSLSPAQAEARARIEVTNYYTCMEYGSCESGAVSTEPEDDFIVGCWGSQSGIACCIGYWCCSVYYDGDFTCYGG